MHHQFNPITNRVRENNIVKLKGFMLALILCSSLCNPGITQAAELEDLLNDVRDEPLSEVESASGTGADKPDSAVSNDSDQLPVKAMPKQTADLNMETEIGGKDKTTDMAENEALPALQPTRYGIGYEYRMNRVQRPQRAQRPERAQRPGR